MHISLKKTAPKPVVVNVIGGHLGAGKTTAINHLLAHRPAGERWAVLVNEYGLVGLDAALLGDAEAPEGVEIKEVAGGCICCSASVMFEVSLVLLLRSRPDRLLIEPTGLATLSGIMDALARDGIREVVDVRSVLCLMDPAKFERHRQREEVQDQLEAADVLLASKADLASPADLETFEAWGRALFPPKRFIGPIEHGRIPLSMLDRVTNRAPLEPAPTPIDHGAHPHAEGHHQHDAEGHHHHHPEGHRHDHPEGHRHDHPEGHRHHHPEGHHHDHPEGHRHGHPEGHRHGHAEGHNADPGDRCDASRPLVWRSHRSTAAQTIGWVGWETWVFDAERVTRWIGELSKMPGALRTKAVLHTNQGWLGYNIADGAKDIRPSGHRRDSRFELILDGEATPPEQPELEQALLECLVQSEAGA